MSISDRGDSEVIASFLSAGPIAPPNIILVLGLRSCIHCLIFFCLPALKYKL